MKNAMWMERFTRKSIKKNAKIKKKEAIKQIYNNIKYDAEHGRFKSEIFTAYWNSDIINIFRKKGYNIYIQQSMYIPEEDVLIVEWGNNNENR